MAPKFLLCGALFGLAGCAHAIAGRAPPVQPAAAILHANFGYLCDDRVLTEYHRLAAGGAGGAQSEAHRTVSASSSGSTGAPDPCDASFRPIENTGATAQQDFRNQVVLARIRMIDANYEAFEGGLYSEGVGSGVAAGASAFALTTTSAALKNSHTQSILSTLAALITGTQGVYNREALFSRTLPALIDAMRADRRTKRAALIENMHKPTDQWSLEDALLALDDYAAAGDLNTAINNVAAQAQQDRQQADQDVAAAQQHLAASDSAHRLRAWITGADGKSDAAKQTVLHDWLAAHHPSIDPIAIFLDSPDAEQARTEFLQDQHIP